MQPELHEAQEERSTTLFSMTPQLFPAQFGRQCKGMQICPDENRLDSPVGESK